jgi:pullulanase/glycogen debranching enzyme
MRRIVPPWTALALAIFLPGRDLAAQDATARLRAEIHGPRAIRAWITGAARPLEAAEWRLTDGAGRPIAVETVIPFSATGTLVVPETALDPRRVHFVDVPAAGIRALARRDPWFRTLYSSKPLGAVVSADGSETAFRLFAPRAHAVRLYLYYEAHHAPDQAAAVFDLVRDGDGVWETTQTGDHHGLYYDFALTGPGDPGDAFRGDRGAHVGDPYARVSLDSFGRSRVWRREPPPRPVRGGRPPMEDVVAYEVHVQDFGDLLPVGDEDRGTFAAMAATGLRNSHGEPIGFDYLVDLGINVVHLLPVQEYLHYPDDEWQAALADDPFAVRMGIDRENYQWGYRTTHAFAVESRYRTRGTEYGTERAQFRALVEAFHDRGIAVIIDVVPNHTGESMDGRSLVLTFDGIDRDYYYRTDDELNHIGPFGNEVKSEERPMVQRWIVDQLRSFVEEFGVDGFRIDLAGQIDEQTLRFVRRELPGDLIIYGEPWIAPSDPDVAANPDWAWYKADAPITFFQDDTRNAIQGSPFDVADAGFAGGRTDLREAAMRAIANDYAEEPTPNAGIGYVDIHDNWTLADRYALRDHDGTQGVREDAVRLAAGLLLTTLGPVVLHGGSEILRSKGLAPDDEFVREIAGGPIHFKGRDDTYNLRAPNRFVWENVGRTADEGPADHAAMHAWWRGLIRLRSSAFGEVLRIGTAVPGEYVRFTAPDDPAGLAYVVGGRLLVAVNVGPKGMTVEGVELPEGAWRMVSDGRRVDHEATFDEPDATLPGGRTRVVLPPRTMKIWVLEPGS